MKYTILIVEDSISVLEALRGLLVASGYEVMTAFNGREALDQLPNQKPHLIISDIMMPVMDGREFFKRLRSCSDWNDIPFIFLTARGQGSEVREAKKLGVDDYLVKPFSSEDLLAIVEGKLQRMRGIMQHAYHQKLNYIRDEIVKALSHELKTPLTKIQGYVELIMSKAYADENQLSTFAKEILLGSRRLEEIVEEFITIARFELQANRDIDMTDVGTVDVTDLAHHAVQKVQSVCERRGVHLNFAEPPEPLFIRVMASEVCEALYHILLNAIKFSEQGSEVNFLILPENSDAVFTIQDFGPGIDSEHLAKIFDKFYQVNRSELEQQGVGLGLTITKIATEKNEGTIQVTSERGEGTTFKLRFPIVQDTDFGMLE